MFLTLGSGAFSPNLRHSCNYNDTTSKGSIYIGQNTGETIPTASFCDQCLNWDAGKDSELQYFKPPQNYSLSEDLIVGKHLEEMILTFEGLIRAWGKSTQQTLVRRMGTETCNGVLII
jgi:hypothetical protein